MKHSKEVSTPKKNTVPPITRRITTTSIGETCDIINKIKEGRGA